MFQDIGERIDDLLYEWHLRWITFRRRLGLYPKPTPEQIINAAAWDRTVSRLSIPEQLSLLGEFNRVSDVVPTDTGKAIMFRKFAPLTTATEITVQRHQYGSMNSDGTWDVCDA